MYIINPPVLDKVRSLDVLRKEKPCPIPVSPPMTKILPRFLSNSPFGYLNIFFQKYALKFKRVISVVKPLCDAMESHRAH